MFTCNKYRVKPQPVSSWAIVLGDGSIYGHYRNESLARRGFDSVKKFVHFGLDDVRLVKLVEETVDEARPCTAK